MCLGENKNRACITCGLVIPKGTGGRNMCSACYSLARRHGMSRDSTPQQNKEIMDWLIKRRREESQQYLQRDSQPTKIICEVCGGEYTRFYVGTHVCYKCGTTFREMKLDYKNPQDVVWVRELKEQRGKKKITKQCSLCGEELYRNGMCRDCYITNDENWISLDEDLVKDYKKLVEHMAIDCKPKVCIVCGKELPSTSHEGNILCSECYEDAVKAGCYMGNTLSWLEHFSSEGKLYESVPARIDEIGITLRYNSTHIGGVCAVCGNRVDNGSGGSRNLCKKCYPIAQRMGIGKTKEESEREEIIRKVKDKVRMKKNREKYNCNKKIIQSNRNIKVIGMYDQV